MGIILFPDEERIKLGEKMNPKELRKDKNSEKIKSRVKSWAKLNPEELSKDKNLEKIQSVYVDLGSYGECSDAQKKPAMTKHRNKQVIHADKVRTGKQ